MQYKLLETYHLPCHLVNLGQTTVSLNCTNLDHADHPVSVVERKRQNLHEHNHLETNNIMIYSK